MKKVKHVAYPIQTDSEQLAQSQLDNREEKIKILEEPKFNLDTSLVTSHPKQLFFKGKAESDNSIAELKTQAIQNRI